jgi:hypothetical protein
MFYFSLGWNFVPISWMVFLQRFKVMVVILELFVKSVKYSPPPPPHVKPSRERPVVLIWRVMIRICQLLHSIAVRKTAWQFSPSRLILVTSCRPLLGVFVGL